MSSSQLTVYIAYPTTQSVPVALEELDIPYNVKKMSFQDREQKSEWFLKINPNGRLPAMVDHSKEDFAIWESSAILLYIAQRFDHERKISYDPVKEPKLYSEQLQWMFFTHGGVAPIQGQTGHFLWFAPERYPYAVKRYRDEINRLYSVLEKRLEGREWLVGPRYSLADICTFPWILFCKNADIDLNDYPNLQKWVSKILARPKTYKGMGVPERGNPEAATTMSLTQTRAFGAAYFGFNAKID